MEIDIDKYYTKDKPINYAKISRMFIDAYEAEILTKVEFEILLWLHLKANYQTGSLYINSGQIAEALKLAKSYANRILLSLKRKKFIFYEDRTGRRGLFEVKLQFYILKSGLYKDIIGRLKKTKRKEENKGELQAPEEVSQNFDDMSKRFDEQKQALTKRFDVDTQDKQVRGSNNDKEKKNLNIDYEKSSFKSVDSFNPKTHEEYICKTMAEELGEKDTNFLLSVYKKHGIGLVEEAMGIYKESDKGHIKNPGAYLNKIVANLIKDGGAS